MESQPQNPEFRNNPENFHPCPYKLNVCISVESQPQNPEFRNNPENVHPCPYKLNVCIAFSKFNYLFLNRIALDQLASDLRLDQKL